MATRNNISESVYLKLKEMFISGELNFGDKIVELDLCETLNTSRTPLREAIKKLEIEGIIKRSATGRMTIMDMNEEKINEIMEIRIALEDIIYDRVINEKFSEDLLKELKENLNLTELNIENQNWMEVRKLFSKFNKILYAYSELDYTISILSTYTTILSKLRFKSLGDVIRIKKAYREHIKMYGYIENKKTKEAKKLNRKHLLNFKESVLKHF